MVGIDGKLATSNQLTENLPVVFRGIVEIRGNPARNCVEAASCRWCSSCLRVFNLVKTGEAP